MRTVKRENDDETFRAMRRRAGQDRDARHGRPERAVDGGILEMK
jgi:hypothetical protein